MSPQDLGSQALTKSNKKAAVVGDWASSARRLMAPSVGQCRWRRVSCFFHWQGAQRRCRDKAASTRQEPGNVFREGRRAAAGVYSYAGVAHVCVRVQRSHRLNQEASKPIDRVAPRLQDVLEGRPHVINGVRTCLGGISPTPWASAAVAAPSRHQPPSALAQNDRRIRQGSRRPAE